LPTFDLSWRPPVVSLIFASAVTLAITGFLTEVGRMPHGDVDGWAVWNTHARLLHRAGSNWKSILPYTFHGDYPLLTSAVAACLCSPVSLRDVPHGRRMKAFFSCSRRS